MSSANLHNLSRDANKNWHCQTCGQQWRGKPRSECPGVLVYPTIPAHLKCEQDLKN